MATPSTTRGGARFLVGAVLLCAAPAFAGPCEAPPTMRTPTTGAVAPRNTHVRLVFPEVSWTGKGKAPAVWVAPDHPAPFARLTLALRARARPERAVDVTRRDRAGTDRLVELVPLAPLAPDADYEVTATYGDERFVLGRFKTSSASDVTAPTWSALARGELATGTNDAHAKGTPHVALYAPAAVDDTSPEAALRYAVWVVEPGHAPSSDELPAAYLVRDPRAGVLLLGADDCISGGGAFTIPHDRASLHLVVRAVDEAGNASAPSELAVALAKDAHETR